MLSLRPSNLVNSAHRSGDLASLGLPQVWVRRPEFLRMLSGNGYVQKAQATVDMYIPLSATSYNRIYFAL